ncbi:hypothetical protein B0H99_101419 [Planomicrobium soli]|uniref:Uncharacterized protein n=1 Tax=Planomicrobium soli TaxID=1176648 RepID=A0A2P8H7K1_9BACL|nr:hypothetical protein [Planomicrobium soli]PSL42171.1 hypothetical protein B0H99_101419 [Planomicrobium soli]
MTEKKYIELNKLADLQDKQPELFPVFSRIIKINGQLVGEVQAYCDEYGKPVQGENLYH